MPREWVIGFLNLARPRPVPGCLLCLPKPSGMPLCCRYNLQILRSSSCPLNWAILNGLSAFSLLSATMIDPPTSSEAKMSSICPLKLPQDFLGGPLVKNPSANAGGMDSTWSGRILHTMGQVRPSRGHALYQETPPLNEKSTHHK